PQATAAQRGDRAAHRQDPRGRAHARAAVAVLLRRQGEVRAGAGARQALLRQAVRSREARRRPGDPTGLRPRGQGAGPGDAVIPAPEADADVPGFVAELGLPGLVDVHTHFLPDRVMDKVWGYFDAAEAHYGMAWPIHYRPPGAERLATLDKLSVRTFAPLVSPHKPGMGRWLTEWVTEFAARTPGAVPTATLFPEPDVADYLGAAVEAGARGVNGHVQVGGAGRAGPPP